MRSEVTIRLAEPKDLPQCAKIINAWIDETDWMPRIHSFEAIAKMFDANLLERRYLLVAEVKNETVGYLSLDLQENHINGLYIAREFRNRNVGEALIDAAKRASPNGLNLWTFQKNISAQEFYHREDFQEIRRTDGDNDEKLPDILFRWQPTCKPT